MIDLRGDGRLMLYTRDDTARPIWNCRIRIPGSKAYKRISLKTTNQAEAERKAHAEYEELYMHVRAGGVVQGRTFKQVFEEWEKLNPNSVHIDRITSHALPHFGKHKIDQIKQSDFTAYWYQRKANGRPLPKGGTKPITNGTLKRERTALLPIFTYAKAKGYIKELPDSNLPDTLKPEKNNRRPVFTKAEWAKVTRNMREWVKPTDIATTRDRSLAVNYFMILYNSGIRVGEARTLRWPDIRHTEDGHTIFVVRGKTGSREVATMPNTKNYLDRIRQHTGDQTLVFCHPDGKPIGSFKTAFAALLDFANVPRGARTIYSLRHQYATDRLKHGVDVYALAMNMGTSVEMIEKHYGHLVSSDLAERLTKFK